MAPETNIGASHPVAGSGSNIDGSEMERKVMNDLLAKMRSFASERGRNVEVAESMVRDSVSLSAREAFEQYVIDYIASDEEELIAKLDGRVIKVKGKDVTISVGGFEVRNLDKGFKFRVLEVFSNPDIAYIALIVGIILLALELKSPGGYVFGITGGILLLIAAYGLRVLPVNFAGVALVVGGMLVIVADLAVGGIGILAVPGFVAMLVGSFLIYRAPGAELLNVSAGFIFGVTFALGLLMFVLLRVIYKALRRRPSSGKEGLVGERVVILELSDNGYYAVKIHGEYWRASCDGSYGTLSAGDEIEVLDVESMTLVAKPVKRVPNSNLGG
jgi:membrane-bound serine protease (ClpP class)